MSLKTRAIDLYAKNRKSLLAVGILIVAVIVATALLLSRKVAPAAGGPSSAESKPDYDYTLALSLPKDTDIFNDFILNGEFSLLEQSDDNLNNNLIFLIAKKANSILVSSKKLAENYQLFDVPSNVKEDGAVSKLSAYGDEKNAFINKIKAENNFSGRVIPISSKFILKEEPTGTFYSKEIINFVDMDKAESQGIGVFDAKYTPESGKLDYKNFSFDKSNVEKINAMFKDALAEYKKLHENRGAVIAFLKEKYGKKYDEYIFEAYVKSNDKIIINARDKKTSKIIDTFERDLK